MSDTSVILCSYNGEGEFKAVNSVWSRRADAAYVIGEQYYVEPRLGRSMKSRAHFFATVAEVWRNLPDELSKRFPTPDHLRRHALIRTGFYNSEQMVCPSEKIAHKIAAFMRPSDEYGVISVDGKVITRFAAKSQSLKAMGKEEFGRSKNAVLDYLSELIGAERQALENNQAA